MGFVTRRRAAIIESARQRGAANPKRICRGEQSEGAFMQANLATRVPPICEQRRGRTRPVEALQSSATALARLGFGGAFADVVWHSDWIRQFPCLF